MPSGFVRLAFSAAFVAMLAGSAAAQVSTGNISGFIRDASGASIPNATISAKLVNQQAVRTTQSNQEGSYTLLALPPGEYEITFEAAGFQRQVQTQVDLSVNQNMRLDASLTVGAVESQVTVESTAPLVDTTSPTLSGLVDDRRVVDLPLNGRNVIGLARILPGVLGVSAPQQLSDARSGPKMNVNGGRPNMNLFTFNGGYFNNPSRNTGMNYPPPDAVQEFRIQTHNFSAEYGRNPGSQINVISKTGTNEIHGSAWEFLRNDALNARNFFADRVPAIKQNQFGAAAGGPVVKDRVFVFGSYQGLRDRREAQTVEALVPSSAQRRGDFTGLGTALMNPENPVTGAPFTDSAGRPCVQNNTILSGCISPVATNFLTFVPDSPSGTVSSLASSPARRRYVHGARRLESEQQSQDLRQLFLRPQHAVQSVFCRRQYSRLHVGKFRPEHASFDAQRYVHVQSHVSESGHLYVSEHAVGSAPNQHHQSE